MWNTVDMEATNKPTRQPKHVACMDRIRIFNPEVYGYQYDADLAPRMQVKPWGWRGYIEISPVVSMT